MDVTYNFTAGTRAVAQQVNTNFADVKSAVDPLETAVAELQSDMVTKSDGSVDFTRLQSYKSYIVSNATNATPIVITAVAHGFLTGDKVYISGVGGNTAANGVFTITKIGTDTFSLDGSVGNGAFSSNGTAVIYPSADDNLINKVYVDNENLKNLKNITQIGTCSTASATAEKAVTLNGFVLTTGATIQVTFTNTNTATTPTLNVNSTGAKAIYNEAGTAVSATNPAYFPAGSTIEFIYNGTNWVFKKRVIENYINGTSWYRVYSDGWIEQGGRTTTNTASITFAIAYKNTNYSVYTSRINASANIGGYIAVITSQSTTGIVCQQGYANSGNDTFWATDIMWKAEGF